MHENRWAASFNGRVDVEHLADVLRWAGWGIDGALAVDARSTVLDSEASGVGATGGSDVIVDGARFAFLVGSAGDSDGTTSHKAVAVECLNLAEQETEED